MKKIFTIKNKHNQKIIGIMEWFGEKKGPLVILCHGFKGFMDQIQIRDTAKYLAKAGYTTVRFDATNSIGRSEGRLMEFTTSGYLNDLKTVINYALKLTKQKEYALIGYSLGSMVSCFVANKDKRVKCLVFQGPAYNLSHLLTKDFYSPEWKKRGWIIVHSNSKNRDYKVGFNFYKEGIKYNTKKAIRKINCPTAIIYGTGEAVHFKKNYNELFKDLKAEPKSKLIINGAPHTLRKEKHIRQFSKLALLWLDKYFK